MDSVRPLPNPSRPQGRPSQQAAELRCMSSLARWHASVALRSEARLLPPDDASCSVACGRGQESGPPPPPFLFISLRHTVIAHPPRSQVQISCRHASCSLHFASRIQGSSEAGNPRTRSGDGLRIAQAGHSDDNCTYPSSWSISGRAVPSSIKTLLVAHRRRP